MGIVEAIFVAPREAKVMIDQSSAHVVPGRGIEGDRYFEKLGTFSKKSKDGREITFIEAEAIEAVGRDYKIALDALETRRNVLTRGVSLNHRVGKTFEINGVHLQGIELCEPCGYLETLTEKPGLRKALVHRGGLRANVVTEGTIQVGDTIQLKSTP